jgi:predicted DNA-binding transcriptional regulator YafY
MRADRLLSILLLLQVHRSLTARELSTRLEVSERTIYRDMEALGAAGVPVLGERGTGGGWRLLEAYRTNLTGLNQAEIQTLFLAKPTRLLSDLGLHQASEAAFIKLLAALPALSRRAAEEARQRLYVDAVGWYETQENLSALPTLQEAIWQERKVRFVYRLGNGSIVERVADPLGLVAKGRVWYLVAAIEDEQRSYRVSRIQEISQLEEPCMRPPGFDLAAYWEHAASEFKASLPRLPVVVRVSPTLDTRLRQTRLLRIEQAEPPEADGWVRLSVLFEDEHEACEQVLRFGAEIEVLEPPSLRERVIAAAQDVVALYRTS